MSTKPVSQKPLSRRRFLKVGCLATAAVGVTVCGGAALAAPKPAQKPAIELLSYSYGEKKMNNRVLVAYASGTGSTIGVAAAIGETLAAQGYAVDVKPVKEDPSPDGYQSVVIGSAVNGAKWLPEAVAYVEKHRQALNQAPVALFCVHIMNTGDDEKSRSNRLAYLDNIRALLKPADEAFFAGMGMNPDEQSWLVRWVYRTFKIGPEGDCRDWNIIRAWAETLPGSLS